jgi:hypothetical protein
MPAFRQKPSSLPAEITQLADTCLKSSTDEHESLVTEFTEIFLSMYNTFEIPARREAKALGPRIIGASNEQAPNRNRLEVGIPWKSIKHFFAERHGVPPTRELSNGLSLILDICNDLGIVVPITVVRDGVVFRAYRHGEDCKLSDSELGLAYELVDGFLRESAREKVPRVWLEKLLVLLIRVGTANRFLEPFFGVTGTEGTASLKFELKGAVVHITTGPKHEQGSEDWLSIYLLRRHVLQTTDDRQFTLGTYTEGNYFTEDAPELAFHLGSILGYLTKSQGVERPPLSEVRLVLLATCWHARHTAAALLVELGLFKAWFRDTRNDLWEVRNWKDRDALALAYDVFISGTGYEAIQSLARKFVGYRTKVNETTVKECEDYLRDVVKLESLSRVWSSYWKAMVAFEAIGERKTFEPHIERCAVLGWDIGVHLFLARLALALAADNGRKNKVRVHETIAKWQSYNDGLRKTGIALPKLWEEMEARFENVRNDEKSWHQYDKAFNFVKSRLSQSLTALATTVDALTPLIERFGKLAGIVDYKYVVHYDIVDSKGNRKHPGQDVPRYREAVDTMEKYFNDRLRVLINNRPFGSKRIFCTRGGLASADDGKHIFLAGPTARKLADDVVDYLLSGPAVDLGVAIRVLVAPCEFAGASAFRRFDQSEVAGKRFWEHFSLLLDQAKLLASKEAPDANFIAVAGQELVRSFRAPAAYQWIARTPKQVSTQAEQLTLVTELKYGTLQHSDQPHSKSVATGSRQRRRK